MNKKSIPPQKLRDIWDKVPDMKDCKGKCAMSCGPIPVSSLERKLIQGRAGHILTTERNLGKKNTEGVMSCNMLTEDGRCSVYSIRPLVCRLWGTTRALACPEGCQPERWLGDQEALDLFDAIQALTGDGDNQAVEDMMGVMAPWEQKLWRENHDKIVRAMADKMRAENNPS